MNNTQRELMVKPGDKTILKAGVYGAERHAAEVMSVWGTRVCVEALNGAAFVVGLEDLLLPGWAE